MGVTLLVIRIIDTIAISVILIDLSNLNAVELSSSFGSILGYVLPILYIVGGNMNKRGIPPQTPPF